MTTLRETIELIEQVESERVTTLTTSDEEFVAGLLPGDVLLLDTMTVMGHIIKALSNRPVNHCVLYLGGGEIAQCTRASNGHAPVRREPLADLLALSQLRTVTAMRHQHPYVPIAACWIAEEPTQFDYSGMIRLGLPLFLRSYRLANHPFLRKVLQWASNRCLDRDDVEGRLTCASFCSRCFSEAGVPIEMDRLGASPWTTTVRDLWESSSFRVPIVLHRPPKTNASGIDGPLWGSNGE